MGNMFENLTAGHRVKKTVGKRVSVHFDIALPEGNPRSPVGGREIARVPQVESPAFMTQIREDRKQKPRARPNIEHFMKPLQRECDFAIAVGTSSENAFYSGMRIVEIVQLA